MRFLVRLVINAAALWVAAEVVPRLVFGAVIVSFIWLRLDSTKAAEARQITGEPF